MPPMNDEEFLETLHKYRDESVVHPLDFRPCIERLIDSQHCRQISRIFYSQSRWEKRRAVASLGQSLPDSRGVYMFVWRPELVWAFENGDREQPSWILYVGKAGLDAGRHDTLRARYSSEYRHFVAGDIAALWNKNPANAREERLSRYLSLRPLEYWFLLLDTPRDIQLLERKLIRMLAPPLNKQLVGPRLKPGPTVPAFEETP